MMNLRHKKIYLVILIGLLLTMAMVTYAQESSPEATAEPDASTYEATSIQPTGDNGYCTICHSNSLKTTRLADGSFLNLYVNPEMIQASVHGARGEDQVGLGCLDCHGDIFPHNQPLPTSLRAYTIESNSMCTSCHVEPAHDLENGLHAQAIAEGNLEAAVCTDCHDAHHVQSSADYPQLVADVCGDCHESTLIEWQMSPHAEMGASGCSSCHSYHTQTLRVGDGDPNALCLNCHSEMPDIHIHDTHVGVDNAVECVECHMYVPETQLVSFGQMPATGHSMLLDSRPCTTCHAELEASGEWTRIVADGADDGDMTSSETTAQTEEDEAHGDESTQNSGITLFQGLLVGLGLGVTFSIIFLNRRPTA